MQHPEDPGGTYSWASGNRTRAVSTSRRLLEACTVGVRERAVWPVHERLDARQAAAEADGMLIGVRQPRDAACCASRPSRDRCSVGTSARAADEQRTTGNRFNPANQHSAGSRDNGRSPALLERVPQPVPSGIAEWLYRHSAPEVCPWNERFAVPRRRGGSRRSRRGRCARKRTCARSRRTYSRSMQRDTERHSAGARSSGRSWRGSNATHGTCSPSLRRRHLPHRSHLPFGGSPRRFPRCP